MRRGWRGERTGASPGALPSVCPLALEAPSPCSAAVLAWRRKMWWRDGQVVTFSLLLQEFLAGAGAAGGLGRHLAAGDLCGGFEMGRDLWLAGVWGLDVLGGARSGCDVLL